MKHRLFLFLLHSMCLLLVAETSLRAQLFGFGSPSSSGGEESGELFFYEGTFHTPQSTKATKIANAIAQLEKAREKQASIITELASAKEQKASPATIEQLQRKLQDAEKSVASAEKEKDKADRFPLIEGKVRFYAKLISGDVVLRAGLLEGAEFGKVSIEPTVIVLLGVVSDGSDTLIKFEGTNRVNWGQFHIARGKKDTLTATGTWTAYLPKDQGTFECVWEAKQQSPVRLLETNPSLVPVEVDHASPEELVALDLSRKGVVADGVSRVLLRVPTLDRGKVQFTIEQNRVNGRCVKLGEEYGIQQQERTNETVEVETIEVKGKHYACVKYFPPDYFDGAESKRETIGDEVECRSVPIKLKFVPESGNARGLTWSQSLKLVRPPVVLIHGTFDDPEACWQTPGPHGLSLAQRLVNARFKPFFVDYRESNGKGDVPSSFQDNKMVLWKNPGGIEEALTYFRDKLNVAATQADVVGHSMGGLLTRVYASSNFPGAHPYARPANFNKGDVHRIITIGTPHNGSDLPRILQYLENATFDENTLTDYVAAKGLVALVDWIGGMRTSGAVTNQIPESPALKQIGATKIPSHAIGGVATANSLQDFDGLYGKSLLGIGAAFYLNMGVLEKYLDAHGQYVDSERLIEHIETTGWRTRNLWLTPIALSEGDLAFVRETLQGNLNDYNVMLLELRAAMFGNWQNDCTVRLPSQLGGLLPAYTTVINDVIHSFEPRYASVQNRVIELLRESPTKFSPAGFLPAGEKVANFDPGLLPYHHLRRKEAIEKSGIVPWHAEAISKIAETRHEILLVRPVNPDATKHISRNAATKDMYIKGKSSNWGPQQGLICTEQRYSKIWRGEKDPQKREDEIRRYNEEIRKSIEKDRVARPKALKLLINGRKFVAYSLVLSKRQPQAEDEIILQDEETKQYWDWRNRQDEQGKWNEFDDSLDPINPPPVKFEPGEIEPLTVLATPDDEGRYITADYDLLAIATKVQPEPPAFDKDLGMGYVNLSQQQLIVQLNQAVRGLGTYKAGKVVHHGPETQYTGSFADMVDYPITIFDPNGIIYSFAPNKEDVEKGIKHSRIKRYFARKKRADWFLEPNPRWRWEWNRDYDPVKGYEDEDAPPPTEEEWRREREEGVRWPNKNPNRPK